MSPSEIIKDSCCGALLCVPRDSLISRVAKLETEREILWEYCRLAVDPDLSCEERAVITNKITDFIKQNGG